MNSAYQNEKEKFEKKWVAKLKNSKYKFKDYLWLYSNRQIRIWDKLHFKLENNDVIIWKVLKKPFWTDHYWKANYAWYLFMEENNWKKFFAHIDNIFKRIR